MERSYNQPNYQQPKRDWLEIVGPIAGGIVVIAAGYGVLFPYSPQGPEPRRSQPRVVEQAPPEVLSAVDIVDKLKDKAVVKTAPDKPFDWYLEFEESLVGD